MPKLVGENVLMRIFIGEGDKVDGRPLHEALVELLKKERFHGATVLRGVAGFGAHSVYHTDKILRLSRDLPMIVEVVDTQENVDRVMSKLDEMIVRGDDYHREGQGDAVHPPARGVGSDLAQGGFPRMDLSGTVARVDAICGRFGVGSLAPQLAACREMLKGGGVLDVAVLGQFKAGKSSFLNGLIGGAVVPVDVLPSTAVVTRIGYGDRERITVHGIAGEPFEIPRARLAEFVTERGNPANEKRVAVVDVELPSLAPYEGVRFVDTPGLGSVFAHNTRVSRDWMPRVGAALVAVSVNHPLSEDDLLLLNDVSSNTPEAVILLTKADLVSGEELASVIGFTRSQTTSRTGKAWTILPVSNRPGFEAMLDGSGGVPAGTDRGAAGGGVRGDRAPQGPCADRRVPGIPASGGTRGGGGRCRPVRSCRGAGARAARPRIRKGGAPASLQPPQGRGPNRGGRAVSRLPWRSDGAGDRESPGGDDGVEGALRDG